MDRGDFEKMQQQFPALLARMDAVEASKGTEFSHVTRDVPTDLRSDLQSLRQTYESFAIAIDERIQALESAITSQSEMESATVPQDAAYPGPDKEPGG